MGLHDDAGFGHELAGVHGGGEHGRGADDAKRAEDAGFEIGKTCAFAGARARAADRDRAHDSEVDRLHILEADAFSMHHVAFGRGGEFEADPFGGKFGGVDAQVGEVPGEVGDGGVEHLAVVERAQADGDLGRVGVAFDHLRRAPLRQLAKSPCRHVGADEVRDMAPGRAHGKAAFVERAPDIGAHHVLVAVAAGPAARLARIILVHLGRPSAGAPRWRRSVQGDARRAGPGLRARARR